MKKMNLISAAAICAALLVGCATEQKIAEKDFKPLFDGKTLNGWKLSEKKAGNYIVKDGLLICPKNGGDLFTEKEYSDFVLRLQFKLTKGGNNGIAFRSPAEDGQIAYIGNEIQLIDDEGHPNLKPGQNCGSLYRIFHATPGAVRPVGQWNECEVTARGRYIKVVMNGKKVAEGNLNDVTDPQTLKRHPGMIRTRGHIGLLGHNSYVEFRNIRIHEFPSYIERPNTPPPGFVSLFNGRDYTNWRGYVADVYKVKAMPTDEWAKKQVEADKQMRQDWKIENGALVYRGKGFNNLVSEKDYGDYELLIDWKVAPKADSGLYLRGCPQVQIWEHNSPGTDPKHPGSGGLYNNKKSANYAAKYADRYVGEWNRFRILMFGDRLHIFLNNQLVVDDIALENYWDRSKPIPAVGPIELQAHTTEVHFRNIYIREIPRAGAVAAIHSKDGYDWYLGDVAVNKSFPSGIFPGPGFQPGVIPGPGIIISEDTTSNRHGKGKKGREAVAVNKSAPSGIFPGPGFQPGVIPGPGVIISEDTTPNRHGKGKKGRGEPSQSNNN